MVKKKLEVTAQELGNYRILLRKDSLADRELSSEYKFEKEKQKTTLFGYFKAAMQDKRATNPIVKKELINYIQLSGKEERDITGGMETLVLMMQEITRVKIFTPEELGFERKENIDYAIKARNFGVISYEQPYRSKKR
jgi:isopentenyl phosphate kinase